MISEESKIRNALEITMTGTGEMSRILVKDEKSLNDIYKGEIINNRDPDKLGRCTIRVFGIYDDIADRDLPWAIPAQTYIGSQMGNFIVPPEKSFVYVRFLDGDPYNPVYVGKVLDSTKRRSNTTFENDYPWTQVLYETDIGDFFEINTRSGLVRYRHNSGIEVKTTAEGNVIVDTTAATEGNINVISERDVNVNAADVNIESSSHTTLKGTTICLIPDTSVFIHGDLVVEGNIIATGTMYDGYGTTKGHKHIGNMGVPTSVVLPLQMPIIKKEPLNDNVEPIISSSEKTIINYDEISENDSIPNTIIPTPDYKEIEVNRTEIARIKYEWDVLKGSYLFLTKTTFNRRTKINDQREIIEILPDDDETRIENNTLPNDNSFEWLLKDYYTKDVGNAMNSKWLELENIVNKYKESGEGAYKNNLIPILPIHVITNIGQRSNENGTLSFYKLFSYDKDPGNLSLYKNFMVIPMQLFDDGVRYYLKFRTLTGDDQGYISSNGLTYGDLNSVELISKFVNLSEIDTAFGSLSDMDKSSGSYIEFIKVESVDQFQKTSMINNTIGMLDVEEAKEWLSN